MALACPVIRGAAPQVEPGAPFERFFEQRQRGGVGSFMPLM
jgi:hypothetical protein